MRKRFTFDSFGDAPWPPSEVLAPYFIDPQRRDELFAQQRCDGVFSIEGLEGTGHLDPKNGRVDVRLFLTMLPGYGASLQHSKWDGRIQQKTSLASKGDVGRLAEYIPSFHGSPMPIGLFIPFEQGWAAVKEFLEGNGDLPRSIEWISLADVPEIPYKMPKANDAPDPQVDFFPGGIVRLSGPDNSKRRR